MDDEVKESVKIVCVGDGAAGKTCSIIAYTQNAFPHDYVPTVYDTYAVEVNITNKKEQNKVNVALQAKRSMTISGLFHIQEQICSSFFSLSTAQTH